MRIVVTGREGQVVRSLLAQGPAGGHEIVPLARPELDLASGTNCEALLAALRPDVLVSAAAYTAVDRAESEPDLAQAVNATGPAALAAAASGLGVPLIHLSTDYVFAGDKAAPYVESDAVQPLGVYGASKLAGEQAVLARYAENTVILRTAWVYSPFGANFVRTMLRLAGDLDEVGVVADQCGNPTSALDIADGIVRVAANLLADPDPALRGVFHMTAAGETTWAGFAEAIFAESAAVGGPSARVRPIATSDYPTPARRPANSRLDCSKLDQRHAVRLPHWRGATKRVVGRLIGTAGRANP